ncbi:MAG: hypothetical protein ACREQI_02000 [Candidatus Binataceae bacterium]
MAGYLAFLVPVGLAIFVAAVGAVALIVEKRTSAERVRQETGRRSIAYN